MGLSGRSIFNIAILLYNKKSDSVYDLSLGLHFAGCPWMREKEELNGDGVACHGFK
jgi:hypothetical protein